MQKNRQNRESAHRAPLARWVGAIVAVGGISLSVIASSEAGATERRDSLKHQERQNGNHSREW